MWSSAPAHLSGQDDALVKVTPLLDRVGDWRAFLARTAAEAEMKQVRRQERSGRPLGDARFLGGVERQLDRTIRRGKPGPHAGAQR